MVKNNPIEKQVDAEIQATFMVRNCKDRSE